MRPNRVAEVDFFFKKSNFTIELNLQSHALCCLIAIFTGTVPDLRGF